MKLLIPVLLALFGLVGGAAAGWMLKPHAEGEAEACAAGETETADEHSEGAERKSEDQSCPEELPDEAALGEPAAEESEDSVFVDLVRPFIVPVVSNETVAALMVVTLSIETEPSAEEAVSRREPKLRDAMLRVLFGHAATGGFAGDFTAEPVMRDLRRNLLIAARRILGGAVRDVLVIDINRQDQ